MMDPYLYLHVLNAVLKNLFHYPCHQNISANTYPSTPTTVTITKQHLPVHIYLATPACHNVNIYLFTHQPVHISTCSWLPVSIYLFTHQPVHISTCSWLPVNILHAPTCPCIYLFMTSGQHLPVNIPTCPYIYLFTPTCQCASWLVETEAVRHCGQSSHVGWAWLHACTCDDSDRMTTPAASPLSAHSVCVDAGHLNAWYPLHQSPTQRLTSPIFRTYLTYFNLPHIPCAAFNQINLRHMYTTCLNQTNLPHSQNALLTRINLPHSESAGLTNIILTCPQNLCQST